MQKIKLIAAVDVNNGLGFQNKLLYTHARDFKHFKDTTDGHIVVMGRKTFESIGKPLPNRINIVLTSDVSYAPQGVVLASSIQEVLEICLGFKNEKDVFIIGGGIVYQQFIRYADELIITEFPQASDKIDVFFPNINDNFVLSMTKYLTPCIKVKYYKNDKRTIR